mgnify:CR=1 FL=1
MPKNFYKNIENILKKSKSINLKSVNLESINLIQTFKPKFSRIDVVDVKPL